MITCATRTDLTANENIVDDKFLLMSCMPDSEMWMGPGLARVCILLMFGVKPSFRF
jgi:hypothetical protein